MSYLSTDGFLDDAKAWFAGNQAADRTAAAAARKKAGFVSLEEATRKFRAADPKWERFKAGQTDTPDPKTAPVPGGPPKKKFPIMLVAAGGAVVILAIYLLRKRK